MRRLAKHEKLAAQWERPSGSFWGLPALHHHHDFGPDPDAHRAGQSEKRSDEFAARCGA
jgi:hypothetical protein